jgi:hypothetical protein
MRHAGDFSRVRSELERAGRERVGYLFSPPSSGCSGGDESGDKTRAEEDSRPPSIRILSAQPAAAAGLLRPAFVLLEDQGTEQLVVVVRGTTGFRDAVTALTTKAKTIKKGKTKAEKKKKPGSEEEGASEEESKEEEVHEGLAAAAEALAAEVGPAIALAAAARKASRDGSGGSWRVFVTGHSAGGGVAALLALHLRAQARELAAGVVGAAAANGEGGEDTAAASAAAGAAAEEALAAASAVAFACPPLASLALARALSPFVTTVLCGADVVPTLSRHALDRLRSHALEIAVERRKEKKMRKKKNSLATAALSFSGSSLLPPSSLPSLLAAVGITSPSFSFPFSPFPFARGVLGAAAQGWRGRAAFLFLLGALLGLFFAAAAAVAAVRIGSAAETKQKEEMKQQEKKAPAMIAFRSNVVPWPGARRQTPEGSKGGGGEREGGRRAATATTTTAARAALFPPGRILHLVPSEVLLEANSSSAAAAAAAAAAASLSEAKEGRESRHGDESECGCGCGGGSGSEEEGLNEESEGGGEADAAALSLSARSSSPLAPSGSSNTVILAAVPHERYGATIRPHRRMLRDHFLPAHLEALDSAAAAFVSAAARAAAEEEEEEGATPAAAVVP